MNFSILIVSMSTLITTIGILLAMKSPSLYLKYFHGIFGTSLGLIIGTAFWNCAILNVDSVLIGQLNPEKYTEVSKIIRREMFPFYLSPPFMFILLVPLIRFYRKLTESK